MRGIHGHLSLPYVLGHLLHERGVQWVEFRCRTNEASLDLNDLALILLLSIESPLVILADSVLLEDFNVLFVDLGLIFNDVELPLQCVFLVLLHPQM